MQPPKQRSSSDLDLLMGGIPNWRDADFCTKEFNGVASNVECEELKQVAAAIPDLPMSPAARSWIARDTNLSMKPLIESAGPVFLPPIAALLIVVALTWALRGF
jgi:hypothetical protein